MNAIAKPWTYDEKATLLGLYRSKTRKEIGEQIGRTVGAVRAMCSEMRLNTKKVPDWTESEIEILRNAYTDPEGAIQISALADKLGRLKSNVCRKARELGLATTRSRKHWHEPGTISARVKAHQAKNGHPRGALGVVHTAEARAKIGAASRASWADAASKLNSEDCKQKRSDNMYRRSMFGRTAENTYSRCKRGRREDLGETFFRSSWEANYARYLNFIQSAGTIERWEYEPRTFLFEKIKRGTRSYLPDFKVYLPDGSHQWHEVKGWMDDKSRVRIARMRKYYPKEPLEIIDSKFFKSCRAQNLHKIIAFWE